MGQEVIWTDDTPIRTLAPGTGKTRLARFWCYAIDPRPYVQGPAIRRCFIATAPTARASDREVILRDLSGYLHADAFAGYEALYRANGNQPPRITHVACMAHARRKVFEVFDATKSPIAEEALRQIQGPLCHRGRDQRQACRSAPERSGKKRSKPLLDCSPRLDARRQRRRLLGKAPLGESIPVCASVAGVLLSRYPRGRQAQH